MSEPTRGRRPSPALVISLIALVMSMAGTATAARVLITSSSQFEKGVVNSRAIDNRGIKTRDLRKGAVTGNKVRDGSLTIDAFDDSTRSALQASTTQALEGFRKAGPENQAPDTEARVATLENIPPGTYAIFAKTILTPTENESGLFNEGGSVAGKCTLDAGGDKDHSRAILAGPGSLSPGVLNMQITRTYGSTGFAGIDCVVSDARWRASDTSIIAIRVGHAPRRPIDG